MEPGAEDVMLELDWKRLEDTIWPILQDAMKELPTCSSATGSGTDQLMQRALTKLWKLINDSNDDRAGHLAGIPLPNVDAELLPLQQEVDAAISRLNARHLAVPALVEAAVAEQLQAVRVPPPAGAEEDAAAGLEPPAAAVTGGDQGGEDVAELLRRTTATTDRLPAIRARLDEALHRLQSNLAVLQDEGGAAARREPRTAEKAILRAARADRAAAHDQQPEAGEARGGGAAAEAGGSKKADGGSDGADGTRRRLARDMLAA